MSHNQYVMQVREFQQLHDDEYSPDDARLGLPLEMEYPEREEMDDDDPRLPGFECPLGEYEIL